MPLIWDGAFEVMAPLILDDVFEVMVREISTGCLASAALLVFRRPRLVQHMPGMAFGKLCFWSFAGLGG